MKLLNIFTLLVLISFSSCYYDNEIELYGEATDCEDLGVSYTAAVLPIISGKCYSCHSDALKDQLGAGVGLEGHANLKVYAESGSLVNSLRGITASIMPPQPATTVSDCNISKISIWISEGAKDN